MPGRSAPDSRRLQRHLPDRAATALRRYRRAGRRSRIIRRALALTLLVIAGAAAVTGPGTEATGRRVMVAAHDLPAGAPLAESDVAAATRHAAPDGAVSDQQGLIGAVTSGPMRRGEAFTDVRLVGDHGPDPGPGRTAVPVHLSDVAVTDLLRPGMHIALVAAATPVDGAAAAHIVTHDAVVLSVTAATGHAPSTTTTERIVLVSVPSATADAVTAAALGGSIGVRFP